MEHMNDTIAAVATPPGNGGIGIIRISGHESERILRKIFFPASRQEMQERFLTYGWIRDGETTLDECMAVIMRAPKSYTCEDVAEIQLHGGSYVTNKVLSLCLLHGARLAGPGEFTRRAFLNGRIDLSRAEAVMSLISARGEQEHRIAVRELQGGAASFAKEASEELFALQAGLAACIDYPEEIGDEEGTAALIPGIERLVAKLRRGLDERSSRLLRDGMHVTLCGRPNVGKSSLLNALLGEDRAIVTDVAGTTRDTVTGEMMLNGIRVILTDTAGMRDTSDPVERIGVERSRTALDTADAVLLILDGSEPLRTEDAELLKALKTNAAAVLNKSDLASKLTSEEIRRIRPDLPCFETSTLDSDTLEPVRDHLRAFAEISDRMALTLPRQQDALCRAVEALESALETLKVWTPDMASTDLQTAQEALSEITGERADEQLLDAVFSQFCVGK